ncbi:37S ribosomal protein Rsm18p, mitochondrial [[Candida] jaroonii]|uniref:37S ribosomal protein Rsm18p, mitochondrial n=1 Tax=[Candida] jaroonii TaxID=467808 RepID=A0ACA9Y620_9ASCO|nr:37S ribosomal protein Rsm18p, mitochondrial [[Candida] jaroonii]
MIGRRFISTSKRIFQNPLPSTPEMKQQFNIKKVDKKSLDSLFEFSSNFKDQKSSLQIENIFTKKFKHGNNYNPFDFSMNKLNIDSLAIKYEKNKKIDPFEVSGINPLDLYTMPFILSRFLTTTGQILPRSITGCSAKNQKKLSIAIKRARVCGLLSYVHKDTNYLPARNI